MKCSKADETSRFFDGELDEESSRAFAAHLDRCAECAARIARFTALRDAFRGADRHPAPPGFALNVRAGIRRDRPQPAIRPIAWLMGAAEAVVVAFLVFAGIAAGGFLLNGDGVQQPNGTPSAAFDVFQPAPPDSVGGIYLAMTEARHE